MISPFHSSRRAKKLIATDIHLIGDLQRLKGLRDNHYELCMAADHFRNLPSLQYLSQKMPTTSEPSPWKDIRHYIGRLGSWPRAAKILAHVAKKYPYLIGSFDVKILATPSAMPLPPPRRKSNLEGALRRILDSGESAKVAQLLDILRSVRDMNIEEKFVEGYQNKNLKPQIHAELLLLEHFYANKLEFVENERYIGCSKPSCYCCELYMQYHPGRFTKRPCHGNVWTNWALPVDIRECSPATRHANTILFDMIKHLQRDVISQIESREPLRPRVQDSTTGMSASIFASSFQPETPQRLVSSRLQYRLILLT